MTLEAWEAGITTPKWRK